ncbi:hypothetical protein BJ742DRAFT_578507 [Cladochytrium replicatum]|nr:hypothetical protein BJ742DRAFT_578507 [Cladochytrium replicatum]
MDTTEVQKLKAVSPKSLKVDDRLIQRLFAESSLGQGETNVKISSMLQALHTIQSSQHQLSMTVQELRNNMEQMHLNMKDAWRPPSTTPTEATSSSSTLGSRADTPDIAADEEEARYNRMMNVLQSLIDEGQSAVHNFSHSAEVVEEESRPQTPHFMAFDTPRASNTPTFKDDDEDPVFSLSNRPGSRQKLGTIRSQSSLRIPFNVEGGGKSFTANDCGCPPDECICRQSPVSRITYNFDSDGEWPTTSKIRAVDEFVPQSTEPINLEEWRSAAPHAYRSPPGVGFPNQFNSFSKGFYMSDSESDMSQVQLSLRDQQQLYLLQQKQIRKFERRIKRRQEQQAQELLHSNFTPVLTQTALDITLSRPNSPSKSRSNSSPKPRPMIRTNTLDSVASRTRPIASPSSPLARGEFRSESGRFGQTRPRTPTAPNSIARQNARPIEDAGGPLVQAGRFRGGLPVLRESPLAFARVLVEFHLFFVVLVMARWWEGLCVLFDEGPVNATRNQTNVVPRRQQRQPRQLEEQQLTDEEFTPAFLQEDSTAREERRRRWKAEVKKHRQRRVSRQFNDTN